MADEQDPRVRIAEQNPTWTAAQVDQAAARGEATAKRVAAEQAMRDADWDAFTGNTAPAKSDGRSFDQLLTATKDAVANGAMFDVLQTGYLSKEGLEEARKIHSRPHVPISEDQRGK
jgi:hypothetical protein